MPLAEQRWLVELWLRGDRMTHFQRLGLAPTCDQALIRRAYLGVAQRLHPDRYYGKHIGRFAGVLVELFHRARAARIYLADPRRCARYVGQLTEAGHAVAEPALGPWTLAATTPRRVPEPRRTRPRVPTHAHDIHFGAPFRRKRAVPRATLYRNPPPWRTSSASTSARRTRASRSSRTGRPVVIPNRGGYKTTPSMVAITESGQAPRRSHRQAPGDHQRREHGVRRQAPDRPQVELAAGAATRVADLPVPHRRGPARRRAHQAPRARSTASPRSAR